MIRTALAAARADDPTADEGAVLAQLIRTALSPAASSAPESTAAALPEAPYRVVVQHCPSCQSLVHVGQSGPREVDDAVAAEIACDHDRVDLTHPDQPGRLKRTVSDIVKRRILHRDSYRCVVPNCGGSVWLHLHHLIPYSEGGASDEHNMVTVCGQHHRLLHRGGLDLRRNPDGTIACDRAPSRGDPG